MKGLPANIIYELFFALVTCSIAAHNNNCKFHLDAQSYLPFLNFAWYMEVVWMINLF